MKSLNILVSKLCNYSCDHCITSSSPQAKDTLLNKEKTAQLLQDLKDIKFKELIFTGGEPLLTANFLKVLEIQAGVEHTVNANTPFSITTNGSEFKNLEKGLDKLKKIKFLKTLTISLDTFHFAFSEHTSYLHGIKKYCQENNVHLYINWTVVSPLELNNVVEFEIKYGIPVNVIKVSNSGRAKTKGLNYIEHIPTKTACPSREYLYFSDKGYSFCCSNLAFDPDEKYDKEVYFESINALEKNQFYKKVQNVDFKEYYNPEKEQFSTVCDLCEFCYENYEKATVC